MNSVVGTFKTRSEADGAAGALRSAGIPADRINLLSPGATVKQVQSVPVTDAEGPGIGTALGAAVGGSVGVAGGLLLGDVLATVLLPGIGAVAAIGVTAAAILGALGAVGGGAAGKAADAALSDGIPADELHVYEDALRQGRSVLIAEAKDEAQAAEMREILSSAHAETIDKARHMWWLGVRGAEKEKYNAAGGDFERDEAYYQKGFEAALHLNHRGKTYDESRDQLEWVYPNSFEHAAFRQGFDRGQAYLKARAEHPR
jgi:outer membrane lipoprotein SlyB